MICQYTKSWQKTLKIGCIQYNFALSILKDNTTLGLKGKQKKSTFFKNIYFCNAWFLGWYLDD